MMLKNIQYTIIRLALIAVLVLIHLATSAQIKELKKADGYFYNFNYNKALKHYKAIEEEGEALYYVSHRIGDCYRHLGDVNQSVNWYIKATEYPDVDYSTYLVLSQQLRKLERYTEAEKYMDKYYELSGVEKDIKELSLKKIEALKRDSGNFEIYELPINSKFSEMGPVIYNDKLLFSSNKGEIAITQRKDIRDGGSFYKLYESEINGLTLLTEPKRFDKKLSSKYNDGPIAFNKEKTIAFLTRNIEEKKKNSYLNIFISHKKNGQWNKSSLPIPLHQVNFSFMHANLNGKDDRIFYVSDMEGGYGGLDIYYSVYENGFLSAPVNLGPTVNSEGNEMFPFVSQDGILYYSSDKPGGFGGLDIFFSLPVGNSFSTSFNMGYPINKSSDDFGLIFNEDNKTGYFVSDRKGGKGKDDIYAFKQDNKDRYIRYEGMVVSSKEKTRIPQAEIKVSNGSEFLISTTTDDKGKFVFYLKQADNLVIEIKKRFFESFKEKLSEVTQPEGKGYTIEVILEAY